MKKFIPLVLLTICLTANAQFRSKSTFDNYSNVDNEQFSWGYYLGINSFNFHLHPSKYGLESGSNRFLVNSNPKTGFTVGLIGKMILHDNFDLRVEPAMHFTQRELIFNNVKNVIEHDIENGIETTLTDKDAIRNIKSTYLDIPLFLNIHGDRWHNTRPYVQAGLSMLVNLQSNEKKEQDNSEDIFRMKSNNFSYQLEAGIEIYFKRFKMTPSVRGIFFLNNELVADNPDTAPYWAGALKSIKSRSVVFSIKFE